MLETATALAQQTLTTPQHDSFFFDEMMAHTGLYSHSLPKKIVIIGPDSGIVTEVLKHHTVELVELIAEDQHDFPAGDTRVKQHFIHPSTWIKQTATEKYDVIIHTQCSPPLNVFHLLAQEGIFIQACATTVTEIKNLSAIYTPFKQAGFTDSQLFHFPQPSHGWRCAIIASKSSAPMRIREKDIYNRHFKTRYYNFDMHKAALALPEFLMDTL